MDKHIHSAVGIGCQRFVLAILISLMALHLVKAQTVGVGAGSYTTSQPPGTVGPPGTIFRTGSGPVPTHKFWTSKYWTPLGFNPGPIYMFPEPLSIHVTAQGLVAGYFPTVQIGNNGTGPGTFFYKPFKPDLTVGVAGLNASAVNVSNSTDWTADFNFGPITTRVGRGMPFIYATTNGANPTVTFNGQPTIFANNGHVLGVSIAGSNYGLFCPPGGSWGGLGTTTLTCQLPGGANYFSLALLPDQAALNTYAASAFSFPVNTAVSWNYNQNTSQVTTTYTVTTQSMNGASSGFLMALYPHQYASLPGGATNTAFRYASPRGPLRVWSGTSFTTTNTFNGILPYLPRTANYDGATLQGLLNNVVNEGNHFPGTDSYFLGTQLGRIAQLLPIARQQDPVAFNTLLSRLKAQLQSWLTANGKTTNLFYYNRNWGSLIGYPASFGSDNSLNDHHFHYGYWVYAAALVGLYDPNWIAPNNWGGMIDLLRREYGTYVRNDSMFPFMRNFDVYAGHSWASGPAPFGDGGNEESVSEAVNAWAGMILLGELTGHTAMRNAAIWAYTLETNAAFYYWFNAAPVNTFPVGMTRVQIANLFDGKSDAGTWFGSQPGFVHGITFLPFTGASLYLGRNPAYVQTNFNEVLSLGGNTLPDWPDLMQMYEALANPNDAFNRWNVTTSVQGGESRAHEYAWIRSLQALGQVHTAVTANWPYHAVFRNPGNGVITHAAFNPTGTARSVNFTDGATLNVPARTMVTDNGATPTPTPTPTPVPTPTPTPPMTGAISVNAGGGTAGAFLSDRNFTGGNVATTTTAINTSLVSAPVPPPAVFQSERWGASTYTFGGFAPGSTHAVRLYFTEFYWTAAGQRRFNITINGVRVLTNFDIFAASGGRFRGIQQNFATTANGSGQIVIAFTPGTADQPKISGITIQ